jgi:hypothetical protein
MPRCEWCKKQQWEVAMEPAARCVRADDHAADVCIQRWTVLCCERCKQQWELDMEPVSDAVRRRCVQPLELWGGLYIDCVQPL